MGKGQNRAQRDKSRSRQVRPNVVLEPALAAERSETACKSKGNKGNTRTLLSQRTNDMKGRGEREKGAEHSEHSLKE
jgi:hypothetical protein